MQLPPNPWYAEMAGATIDKVTAVKTIVENDYLKVSVVENISDDITLCFTGIGHAIGGVDIQSDEFMRASTFSTAFFIVDKSRSWGNNIDFVSLSALITDYKAKKINAIGNSMGGYLAILASRFIDISTVIAFVPQYSVSKEVVPTETRWDSYVKAIQNWKYKSLEGCFLKTTTYYILAGVGGCDDKHLDMIPNRNNIKKIYFRNRHFIHNTAAALKQDGVLYKVMQDCFDNKDPGDIIAQRFSGFEYRAFDPNTAE